MFRSFKYICHLASLGFPIIISLSPFCLGVILKEIKYRIRYTASNDFFYIKYIWDTSFYIIPLTVSSFWTKKLVVLKSMSKKLASLIPDCLVYMPFSIYLVQWPNPRNSQILEHFTYTWDFSGDPVVKTLDFQCRGHGFDPWWGNLGLPLWLSW